MEASMADDAQLTWERRFAPWAAGAALTTIALQVAGILIGAPANKDAPGRNDPLPIQQSLRNFHEHANALLASQLCQAISSVFAAVVLFYLFRATRARRKELPAAVQWVLVIGPVLFLIAVVVSWSDSKAASNKYTAGGAPTQISVKTTKDQRKDATEFCKKQHKGQDCVASAAHQEAVAKKISDDNRSPIGAAAGFGGVLALGFSYIIIALNAMRAGLLSRFTGILGVIVGALTVLPLLPGPVVQIFWLGSLAVLFLGRWPGVGRGPAWESGRAEPWPVPERRGGGGGLFGPRQPMAEPDPEPEPTPEPEPATRPASRKRRRKKKG
jgi:hypothetical protein